MEHLNICLSHNSNIPDVKTMNTAQEDYGGGHSQRICKLIPDQQIEGINGDFYKMSFSQGRRQQYLHHMTEGDDSIFAGCIYAIYIHIQISYPFDLIISPDPSVYLHTICFNIIYAQGAKGSISENTLTRQGGATRDGRGGGRRAHTQLPWLRQGDAWTVNDVSHMEEFLSSSIIHSLFLCSRS